MAVVVAILQEIVLVETLAGCVFRSIENELLDSLEGFIWEVYAITKEIRE